MMEWKKEWRANLLRLMKVRREELRVVLLLAGVLFVTHLVDGVIDVIAVSSFVGYVGVERLSWVWLVEGGVFILFSSIYVLLVDRWPKPQLLAGSFLLFGLLLVAVRLMIGSGASSFLVYSILYLLRGQMHALFGVIFGAMTSDAFSVSASNRLTPVIGFAGFVGLSIGSKIGGESGHLLTNKGLDSSDLLLFTAGFMASAAILFWLVNRVMGSPLTAGNGEKSEEIGALQTLREVPRFFRDVRIFAILAAITFIAALTLTIVLYQFLARGKSIHSSHIDFQDYYGNVQAILILAIFAVQWLVVNRFTNKVGAANTLLALPLVLMIGGVMLGLLPGIVSVLVVMSSTNLVYRVFDRQVLNVLSGLVPQQLKGRVSTFLVTFMRPLGWIAASGILMLAVHLLEIGWFSKEWLDRSLGGVLLLGGIVALFCVLVLRKQYATYLLNWRLARRKRHAPTLFAREE